MDRLRTVKSLWIAEDGTRLPRKLVVVALSPRELELVAAEKDSAATSIYLSSLDAFSYKGSALISGENHQFSLRVFRRNGEVLIYGNWRKLQVCGEVCIEAQAEAPSEPMQRELEEIGQFPPAA